MVRGATDLAPGSLLRGVEQRWGRARPCKSVDVARQRCFRSHPVRSRVPGGAQVRAAHVAVQPVFVLMDVASRRRDFCSVVQMRFGLPTVNVSMLIVRGNLANNHRSMTDDA